MKPKFTPKISRDEFEALACRKPSLDGDWLYRYEAYSICVDDEVSPLYPKFDLWKESSRLFRNFDDAEDFLRNNKPSYPDCKFYCHCITQIPVGENENEAGASWLYDGEKNLIDYTRAQWTAKAPEDYHFFGKPKELLRFSPGEIVEVRRDAEVHLALLVHPSPDVEWCWQYLQRVKSRHPDDPMPYALDRSEYYDHDGYCGRLIENQIKALMHYLTHTEACRTNWWYMLRNWNDDEAEDGFHLPLDTPLPDYSQLIN